MVHFNNQNRLYYISKDYYYIIAHQCITTNSIQNVFEKNINSIKSHLKTRFVIFFAI